MGDAGIDEQKPSVADDDADVLVVERIAADEDAIADLLPAGHRRHSTRRPVLRFSQLKRSPPGSARALRVWFDHRPAEPDLARTSEGSRPADSTPSWFPDGVPVVRPGTPGTPPKGTESSANSHEIHDRHGRCRTRRRLLREPADDQPGSGVRVT